MKPGCEACKTGEGDCFCDKNCMRPNCGWRGYPARPQPLTHGQHVGGTVGPTISGFANPSEARERAPAMVLRETRGSPDLLGHETAGAPLQPWGSKRTAAEIMYEFRKNRPPPVPFRPGVRLVPKGEPLRRGGVPPGVWDRISPEPASLVGRLVEAPPPSTAPHKPKKTGLDVWARKDGLA